MELRDLLIKKFDEKFENGDFDKLISNALDDLLKVTLDAMFSWDSTIRQELRASLAPIMQTAIANSNLDNIAAKTTLLLNQVLANSEINKVAEMGDELKEYLGSQLKICSIIKLGDIFAKYKEFVEEEARCLNYNEDKLSYEEGTASVYFDVSLKEIDDGKKGYLSDWRNRRYRLSTKAQNEDEIDEEINFDIDFKIDSSGYLNLCENIDIARLSSYPAFIWYLIRLSQQFVKVKFDRYEFSDELYVEVDE